MSWERVWAFLEPNLIWIAPLAAVLLLGLTFRSSKRPPPQAPQPPNLDDLAEKIIAHQRLPGDVEIDERELRAALEALEPDQLPPLTTENPDNALAQAEDLFRQRFERQRGSVTRTSPEAGKTARHWAILAFLRHSAKAETAYSAAQMLNPDHPAIATQLGALALRRGDLAAAQQAYESALGLAQKADDRVSSAIAQGNLGILHQISGDPAAAEDLHRSALAENQTVHRERGIATQCSSLGILFHLSGDHDRAQRFQREAISVSDHADHDHELIELYELLTQSCESRGDLAGEAAYLSKALSVQEALGQMPRVAQQHERLGTLAQRGKDLETARQHWARAREIYEVQGDNLSAERMANALKAIPD